MELHAGQNNLSPGNRPGYASTGRPGGYANMPASGSQVSGPHGTDPRFSLSRNVILNPLPGLSGLHPALLAPKAENSVPILDTLTRWRDHAEEIPKERFRWPLEAMPLSVFIEPNAELPGIERVLISVIRQWEAASQGLIRFGQAGPLEADRQAANIHVQWSDETVTGREAEVGHAKRTVQGQRITHALITLIRHPIIDAHLTPERQKRRLHATILHESGHALGLEHSEHAQDVMHHRGWQHPTLSENDIQRLLALYASPNNRCF